MPFGCFKTEYCLSSAVRIRKPRTRARVVVSSKSGRPPQVGTSGVIGAQGPVARGHPSAEADDCASAGWPAKSLIFEFSPVRIVGVTGN